MTGAELKALRVQFDLSIAKAARQVEVNARTWSRWESGSRAVPDSIVKLFKLINETKSITHAQPTITLKRRGS